MGAAPLSKIAIVGGGTSGWMTAAALARFFSPQVKIRLVESDEIATVGVGEATVQPIRQFHNMLQIDEGTFMKAAGATFKLGIQFNNWGRVGHRYFHPFGHYGLGADLGNFPQVWLMLQQAGLIDGEGADSIDSYSLCTLAAEANRVTAALAHPGMAHMRAQSAYHFDAGRYALFLRAYACARGVERTEGQVVDVRRNAETGFVEAVVLKSGETIEADLFVDCSGMRALLIEGACGVDYIDWNRWLPMNRACVMPSSHAGPIQPFTMSTATEGGWQWRIPIQERISNGHVFSTDHISEARAEEILLELSPGKRLADPRIIKFRAGRREKLWDKNVVAVGLSSGFIEPLESTSIYMIQSTINRLLTHFPDQDFSPVNRDVFNRRMTEEFDHIRDFIIMHYHLTEREDSSLWRQVKAMDIPDDLKHRLDLFRERGMIMQFPDEMFGSTSWFAIMIGQGVRPRGYSPLLNSLNRGEQVAKFKAMQGDIQSALAGLPLQDKFLNDRGWVDNAAMQRA